MEYVEFFDSLQSFSETINSRPTNKPFKDYYKDDLKLVSMRETDSIVAFSGTKSYAEADRLLREGDYENLNKLKAVNLQGTPKQNSEYKTQVRKSVCGSLPNVPLYLRGVPACMLDFRRTKVPGRTVNLIINIAFDYNVSVEDIVKTGAIIASAIKEIEGKGIRINLYALYSSAYLKDSIIGVVNLKRAESPLNMLNIAYPLINPSFLRRTAFRFTETVPVKKLPSSIVRRYGDVRTIKNIFNNTSDKRLQSFKDSIQLDLGELCQLTEEEIISSINSQLKKR